MANSEALKPETFKMVLTRKEAAFISIMRKIRNGRLEGVIVMKGEPVVITDAKQRIDFDKPDELDEAIKSGIMTLDMEPKEKA